MSQKEIGLPGFWRFVWLFFMQPVMLHRLLRAIEIDPEQSGWRLFRKRRSPQENWWLARSIQTMLLMPCVASATVGILHAFGQPIEMGWTTCRRGFRRGL